MTRRALLPPLALAAAVTACTAPPRSPVQGPAAFTPASLKAGCLLPDPELLGTADRPIATTLRVRVDEAGTATDAQVVESTGSDRLDDAFRAAARRCLFTPAETDGTPTRDSHELAYAWTPDQSFLGPARCFMPPYPRRALRAGDEATVRIQFLVPSAGGAVQVRAQATPASTALSTASTEAVTQCLAHPEARVGIAPDTWHAVHYVWRLED